MLKLLQLHAYAPTVVFSFVTQSRHNQDTLSNLRTFNTKILRFRVSRSTFFNSDLNYFLLSTFREQRQTILILDTRSWKRISHFLSSCTLHTIFFISFGASSILVSVRHFLKHFEDIFNFSTIGCCVHHTCTLDDLWSIGIEYSLAEMKNIRISLLVFAISATV